MWFKMPSGCEEISIEQQSFRCEFEDTKGGRFFRAPDHFAAKLLAIAGFDACERAPEGAPEDTTQADTLRDDAIRSLTAQIADARRETGEARTAHTSLLTQFNRQQVELDVMAKEKGLLIAQVKELEEELEGFRAKPQAGTKRA